MRTQTAEVYESLKSAIADGTYKPSESLTELELAAQFGVSRNTVKKALLMLEKEHLVVIERNKSAKVRAFSVEDVLELLEIRELLEGFVARKAIPVLSAEEIARMEELLATMKSHIDNNEFFSYSKCNQLFHMVIYDACPSRTAVEMILSIKNQLAKYNTKTILIPGRNEQSMSEHTAILNAAKQKDAELADMLIRRHIANVRNTFRENYKLLF